MNLRDDVNHAFTIRRTKLKVPVTDTQYLNHMKLLCIKTNSKIIHQVFELKGGLHMHGVISIPFGTNMKLFRVRGWNIRLDRIYDMSGWKKYLQKELILKKLIPLTKTITEIMKPDNDKEVEEFLDDIEYYNGRTIETDIVPYDPDIISAYDGIEDVPDLFVTQAPDEEGGYDVSYYDLDYPIYTRLQNLLFPGVKSIVDGKR